MDSTLYNGQCRDCGAPLIDCKCHKESKMDTRTLEQVIMDASRGFYEPRARSHMVTAEAEVIADAVREWMRERECIMPGSLCKKTQDNARIKELEAEVERLMHQKCCAPDVASCAKEWESDHQTRALLEYGLADEFPFGIDAIQHVAEALIAARAEVERLKAMTYLPSNEAIDKAAKYDALRKRFPFLPGEEFYATVSSKRLILNVGDPIPELIIYKRTVNLVGVNGVLDTKDNTWNWDECHPTAEACKAAIPVEE